MSPFFSHTRCFPPDNLDPIMIPIGALFLVRLELNLSYINQNDLKHHTYTVLKAVKEHKRLSLTEY